MNEPRAAGSDVTRLVQVGDQISRLRADVERCVDGPGPWDDVHPQHRDSARNLRQYLELRRHDVRRLQTDLAELGLSSLGRLESQVEASVAAVDRYIAHDKPPCAMYPPRAPTLSPRFPSPHYGAAELDFL